MLVLSLAFPSAALADTTIFLRAGSQLDSCNTMASPNGRYILQLACDGNLRLIEDQQNELWSSGTSGIGAATLEMQRDGNLVLYAEGHVAKWASGTAGNADAALGLQDDGNLVVIASGNRPVWATNTNNIASGAPAPARAPAMPVDVNSLGKREQALHGLLPAIRAAAGEWGVDEQLLTAIVHHEGGAYLDIRMTGNQYRDYAIGQLRGGSVGIAQIQVGTARRVLAEYYGITGEDDETIAVNLIRDSAFSIRLSAAYLSSLETLEYQGRSCGGNNSRELFILYAVDGKLACTLRDYGFDVSKLGTDVAVALYMGTSPPASQAEVNNLKARQGFYESSWRQAGLVLAAS
jgi:hypothetical protein